ncbi:MAG: hypothetical protein HY209_04150 [Candidatus Omnitrophica bacterium]|nr:hypothetical protein [Candidatus Omnitrophota bacterium]
MAAFVLSGCSQKIEHPLTVTEAQKKFEDKCLKDFNLHVRTRQVGHSFWVYLPVKEPIFDYEVQKNKAPEPKNSSKFAVNFADGTFHNDIFSFEYDMINKKKSKEEDYGFASSYTDSYSKTQNNIFTAISDVFFNAKAKGDEQDIKFCVVIITDIKKGIETKSTFYLQDFMHYMTGALPYEEYMKRFLADQKGSLSMIGDETGSHIKYSDITMEDFLTKQIINRIRFKFTRSDFPPGADYDTAIIDLVADALRYYHFENFTNVRLNNLRLDKKYLFDRTQLANFGEEKPQKSQGRLIRIRFDNGKATFNEEIPSDQQPSTSDGPTNQ